MNRAEKIKKFIKKISTTFNLDYEKLMSIYTEISDKLQLSHTLFGQTNVNLQSLKKDELVALCKSKNLRYSGTKQELIQRLEPKSSILPSKTTFQKKKKLFEDKELSIDVIKSLIAELNPIVIRKNKNGRFEDRKHHLIFDEVTKKVIGKEDENGNLIQLEENDIIVCKKLGYDYELPENLDKYEKKHIKKDDILIEEGDEDIEEEGEDIGNESD